MPCSIAVYDIIHYVGGWRFSKLHISRKSSIWWPIWGDDLEGEQHTNECDEKIVEENFKVAGQVKWTKQQE